MAAKKAPAFQLYANDFLAGTRTMSLQEVGAYMRLLCHQWDAGSVPDDANERAIILCCAKAQERELWKKVGQKFVLSNGAYINERLESERRKQEEYRRKQAENGKASAAARGNGGSTTVITIVEPSPQPESNQHGNQQGNQKATLQSSSSSSKEQVPVTNTLFDRWWSAYPKKIGKGGALKAWKAILVTEPILESMLSALQWQRTQPQWTKDGGAYIPYPATYLNQRRWEDEPFFTTPIPEPILESGPDHPHLKKLREMGITV